MTFKASDVSIVPYGTQTNTKVNIFGNDNGKFFSFNFDAPSSWGNPEEFPTKSNYLLRFVMDGLNACGVDWADLKVFFEVMYPNG